MDENVTNFLYKGLGSRVLTQQGGEKKKEEKAKLLTPLAWELKPCFTPSLENAHRGPCLDRKGSEDGPHLRGSGQWLKKKKRKNPKQKTQPQ